MCMLVGGKNGGEALTVRRSVVSRRFDGHAWWLVSPWLSGSGKVEVMAAARSDPGRSGSGDWFTGLHVGARRAVDTVLPVTLLLS
jgi:hypothetical protein